jgi:CRP-like cAMP-binding protein
MSLATTDNRLLAKLQGYVHLSDADRLSVVNALEPTRQIPARTDIVCEGDDPLATNVILDGWAYRCRQLNCGRRQIVSLLLPGDLFDPHVFLRGRPDQRIRAITPVSLGQITGSAMQAMISCNPALRSAFYREALTSTAIQQEWLVSLGIRTGIERLAHLFCELRHRLAVVGLATDTTCPLPLTQQELVHALGQSTIHINRT